MLKIRMFITKCIYGKYSFQYVDLYRKFGYRSPFLRCFKNDFFTQILIFLNKDPEIKKFETSETIQYENSAHSLTSSELIHKKGLPFCFSTLVFGNYDIVFIGYRETLQNTKIKSVYIFANEVFIMGEHSFKELNKKTSGNILNEFTKKYISTSIEGIDKFFIKDHHQNYIHCSDNGFETSIKYFLTGNSVLKKIYSDFAISIAKSRFKYNEATKLEFADMF